MQSLRRCNAEKRLALMLEGQVEYNKDLTPNPVLQGKIGVDEVLDILAKTEIHETETEYGYTEQKGIGSKPTIVATGEALKRYSLPMKLHVSFCNPSQIIKDLESKAKNREVFDYFQGENYIGRYVIYKIHKSTIEQYLEQIICAEISVELLESSSDDDKTYKPQTKKRKQPSGDLKKVEIKPQTPVQKVTVKTKSISESLTKEVLNAALRRGDSYINSITNKIPSEIKNGVSNVVL